MTPYYRIREAVVQDVDTLVSFTLQEARDAEGVKLDEASVRRGVLMPFEDSRLATYWVAETAEPGVVGSISVATEWSDFHGGFYWWVHSLFIVPEHRGGGLVDALLDHVAKRAQASGALNLRLYAHHSNARALRAYVRCGFAQAPYVIMTRQLNPR